MQLKPLRFFALAALLTTTAGSAHAAMVYDAVADFSSVNGGSSPWSYAFNSTTDFTTRTNLNEYLPGVFGGELDAWHNSGGAVPNSVIIGKNTTGSDISYETIVQPPDYLTQDPEAYRSADLVFTAPSAGFYAVSYNFLGIDTQAAQNNAAHPVGVLLNGAPLLNNAGTISGYGASFGRNFTQFLGAGQTLDFQTLSSPITFAYLSTGVKATVSTVSPVPLPSSFPMFGAALLGMGLVGYGASRKTATRSAA